MKLYTRRGDQGETDLFGGRRVAKDDRRVEAYGAVDELAAALGVCAAATRTEATRRLVERVQETLFTIGSELASTSRPASTPAPQVGAHEVAELERAIDALEAELPPLRAFVLPGGSPAGAAFHLARTVCRRAERRVVALHRAEPLSPDVLRYLNRLSDLLFALARHENRLAGVAEREWRGRDAKRPESNASRR